MIQAVKLARQHRNDDVGAAIVIIILEDGAHPRKALAVGRERDPRFKRAFLKSTIAVVVEEVLLHAVVGDKNVREAISVVVGERNAERLSFFCRNTGPLADVLEGTVAAVPIEQAGRRGKYAGRAIGMPVAAANLVVIGVPFHVASYEE